MATTKQAINIPGAIIGIDLGTTLSLVTYFDRVTHRVAIIPDGDTGMYLVPSVVYYPPEGDPVVGQDAVHAGMFAADRLARRMKMSMGTDFKKKIGDRSYTPQQVAADVLKKLKHNAERFLNVGPDEFASIVITVPAYFKDAESDATMEAARLAGFNMDRVRLFAEPCAAALAYLAESGEYLLGGPRRVLVSDLGGGTYDATMIETVPVETSDGRKHLQINVAQKEGSKHLGGELWDDKLEEEVKRLCREAEGHHGAWDDPNEGHRVREAVVNAKHVLSRLPDAKTTCCLGKQTQVTVQRFEEITESLLIEAETKLRQVLENDEKLQIVKMENPSVTPGEIEQLMGQADEAKRAAYASRILRPDPVLLAGGASNMPQVKRMVKDVTGREPIVHRNLEQIVAMGAAYEAAMEAGEAVQPTPKPKPNACPVCGLPIDDPAKLAAHTAQCRGIVFQPPKDILGDDVGIVAVGDVFGVVLHKDVLQDVEETSDEADGRPRFATAFDDQETIIFEIRQGPSAVASENEYLGEAVLRLKSKQPKGTPVTVKLSMNRNKMVVGRAICHTKTGDEDTVIEVRRKR
jgi:molecular chaperone DnaK (HSP70)